MSALARKLAPQQASLVEGEFAFTAQDFERIATALYERAGIHLTEAKAALVYSRLAKRIRQLGLPDFRSYCDLFESPDGVGETDNLLTALTTNVTRFFREPHHFDHLRDQVLAPMVDAMRSGARVRLWSAASSTGQEPYTMALTLTALVPEAADLDVRILATDIDKRVLKTGQEAIYNETLLDDVPPSLRGRGFERMPDGRWRVRENVRRLVSFKELNLIGAWPMKGPFQAIFCRNVVIYFDEPTQEKVWRRFAPLLAPGGRLYIGHSERINPNERAYEPDGLRYRLVAALDRLTA